MSTTQRRPAKPPAPAAPVARGVPKSRAALLRRIAELEAEVLRIGDAERERIGQDLHDDLCQQLSGIELRTEALRSQLGHLPPVQAEVEKLGGFLRVAMLHARTLVHGLAPVQLEAQGLMAALERLAADRSELFRVGCVFRCPVPVGVSDRAATTHLYRIAQEAISNAIRHGQAKNIVISLAPTPAGARLAIEDDGRGCRVPLWKSGGLGLRTMQSRSGLIGATLRVEPAAGGGTAVVCIFPLR